ncbi:3-isopropylmalate dehydratase large subunit [Schinkia azotoformans]|uniref:3-isopropylmalate dehydratase large subunit n=1 Tax=Schinkia azotoformans TaxID=1454 RepID=UPI002DBCD16A|nr:3-isopropylmalate dehydratase large subunit [Schinkia azotoformans]MEC1716003.1 3-isopropylmalate dehydratase large subunit [Schinkia azotoformans]MEC1740044.1 3-isopropylmalate dehydratase large subunit [Schinkia azotoformans]MEC1744636.1 3-isopropylmalate dehydratase large subunit [Schinkia azotoformans]MEC1756344.1 3-isopropylmalate dehydratase large subunit [Schinkia azotoformans]MEC1768123.1 3-isopropylmalate dehydratase large subunit [Schinkia azotoformans]
MGQTMIEKIISSHAGKDIFQNEIAIVDVDMVMASDTTAPLTIKSFEEMGGINVWDRSKVVFVIDHAAPAPNERIANLHSLMRDFAKKQSIILYDAGDGICHQLMVENQHVKPGQLVLGADSHTCTYGALGAFATGVGSTDLAAVLLTGKTWIKVPETIKIQLNGTLQPGVSAKDLILFIVGHLGIDGATYKAIEFTGEAIKELSLDSRLTIANMAIEMGAKAGFVDTDGLKLSYDFEHIKADEDAIYDSVHVFDVSQLEPQVAIPHSPDNVKPISEVEGVSINQAFLGSCTNGRLEDLHEAAKILKGKKIHPNVRMIIAAASMDVHIKAVQDGTAEILMRSGATFLPSGCGPCVGTHLGVPGNEEGIISSTNRNFRGRMGNRNSNVYLASPATVAASALYGKITNPKLLLEGAVK